jgi:hypothetical protein
MADGRIADGQFHAGMEQYLPGTRTVFDVPLVVASLQALKFSDDALNPVLQGGIGGQRRGDVSSNTPVVHPKQASEHPWKVKFSPRYFLICLTIEAL